MVPIKAIRAITLHDSTGLEAVAAVDRTIPPGLERYLGFYSAIGADNLVQLAPLPAEAGAGAFTFTLAGIAALPTTRRLILKSFLFIKSLFASSKYELLAAIPTFQCFIDK
jgi:hypothetical protein